MRAECTNYTREREFRPKAAYRFKKRRQTEHSASSKLAGYTFVWSAGTERDRWNYPFRMRQRAYLIILGPLRGEPQSRPARNAKRTLVVFKGGSARCARDVCEVRQWEAQTPSMRWLAEYGLKVELEKSFSGTQLFLAGLDNLSVLADLVVAKVLSTFTFTSGSRFIEPAEGRFVVTKSNIEQSTLCRRLASTQYRRSV